MNGSQRLRSVVATVLMAAGVATAQGQQTAAPPVQQKMSFDIASQTVANALTALGQQSGLTIMLASAAKGDAVSPAIVGDYTPDEALKKILDSSGLKAEYLDPKTVSVHTAQVSTAPAQDNKKAVQAGSKQPPQEKGDDTPVDTSTSNSTPLPDTTDAPKTKAPEILVTGSRVMNVDVQRTEDDVQPYTILTSQQIERSGATSIDGFLKQQLTMNTVTQLNSQAYGNISGAGSTSSINLRGLGTNETLVLVDGRRLAGVSLTGTATQPDINGIPLSAVERIEVLPSSASAIYGGAALGGVVNIVLKRNFDGGVLAATYDSPLDVSARTRRIDASYGFSLDQGRTQVMVSGSYSDGTPLFVGDRSKLFARNIDAILANSPAFLYSPAAPFPGQTPNIGSLTGSNLTLKNGASLANPITSIPLGAAPGSSIASALVANAGVYNLNPSMGNSRLGALSEFGIVPREKSLAATIRQSVVRDIQLFAEFMTASNSSRVDYNPFSTPLLVTSRSPANPFQQNVRVSVPSIVDAFATSDSVTQSWTVGGIAPLVYGWNSELDYTWSRNSFETTGNNPDSNAINADLLSGTLNPFVDTIAHPLPLGSYLSPTRYSDDSTLNDLALRASGPLGSFRQWRPMLTIGLEHRKEGTHDGRFEVSYPISTANSYAQEFFGQSQSTNSVYVEANVPVVSPSQNAFGVRSLDFQLAGRTERYTIATGTPYAYLYPAAFVRLNPPQGVHNNVEYTSTSPTFGLKYSPITSLSFRASYSGAFLPPTPAELLPNPTPCIACANITDPKNGRTYSVNTTGGGNPHLRPQTARSLNFGLIWEAYSGEASSLRVDIEYYRIKQPNYIALPGATQVVSDPALAGRVTRDPASGLITSLDLSPLNAQEYKTAGWDAKIYFRRLTSLGAFSLSGVGTYVDNDLRQYQIGSSFLDYAGYPNDGGEVKLKANATASWEFRGWTASWTSTYYSSYWQVDSPGSPSYIQTGGKLTSIPLAQGANSIPSQIYHDLFLKYSFGEIGARNRRSVTDLVTSGLSLEVGVSNVFGKKPPLDASFSPYYYSPLGDPRLRDYRLTLAKKF